MVKRGGNAMMLIDMTPHFAVIATAMQVIIAIAGVAILASGFAGRPDRGIAAQAEPRPQGAPSGWLRASA
jgi:hypothetical protein